MSGLVLVINMAAMLLAVVLGALLGYLVLCWWCDL